MHRQCHGWIDVRGDGRGNRVSEESHQAVVVGDGGTEAAAAREEAGDEGDGREEEGDHDEDPAETPEVVDLLGGGAVAAVSDQGVGGVVSVGIPGVAEGVGSLGAGAVDVAIAADVEVRPLRDLAGAGDALSVRLKEVGLVERRGVADAREDEEQEHGERAGHEDQASEAENGAYRAQIMLAMTIVMVDSSLKQSDSATTRKRHARSWVRLRSGIASSSGPQSPSHAHALQSKTLLAAVVFTVGRGASCRTRGTKLKA